MAYESFEEEEFSTQFNGHVLRRLLGLMRPYRRVFVTFLATVAGISLLDSLFTFVTKLMIDDAIIPGDQQALVRLAILYGGLILVQAAAAFGMIYLAALLGERILYDLRVKMFSHLQQLSLSYFNRTPIGWIVARVTSDTERITELATWGLLEAAWGLSNIAIALIFMLIIDWRWWCGPSCRC